MTDRTERFRRSLLTDAKIPGRGSLAMAMGVVGLLSALLVALLVWQNQVTHERALADARLLVFHQSRIQAERVAAVTEIADMALWQVAETLRARGEPAAADAARATSLLRSILPRFPKPSSLSLHDGAGRRVAAVGVLPSIADVSGLPFFGEHKAGQLGFAVSVEDAPARVRISRRLEGEGGAFAGTVSALLDPAAFELARDLDVTQRLDGAVLAQASGRLLAAWPHASTLGGPGATDIAELPLFAQLPRPYLSAAGAETVDLGAAVVATAPVRNAPILAMAAISRDRALAAWHAEWRLTLAAIAVLIAAIGFIGLRLGHRHARRREAIVRTLSVLARAVEDSPAMTVITGPDGTLEYANRTFEEVTGYEREEVEGATPPVLAAGHAQPGALDGLWSAVRAGRGWSGVIETRKKSGQAFWLSLSVSPIADAHGAITNFVAVGRDVTERIENERYRRRTEKAQALRTLVNGIAHEFNNLLTPMLTMTNLAMEGLPADSREHQMLDVASRAAQRARDLVRRVRIFARDNPEKWQIHDAAGLVKDAVAAAGATLPAGVTLRTGIADGIGRIRADAPQIEAAMANLIANAIDAIGPVPGTVTVSLKRAQPDDGGPRPPPDLAPGPYAVLAVTDTGEGIAPEVIERMFDPFFSTREVGQGTGLGLSIVQGVVTTHGGAITVDSRPGAGTTFFLFLPLLEVSSGETETWTPTPDWPQQAAR